MDKMRLLLMNKIVLKRRGVLACKAGNVRGTDTGGLEIE